MSSKEWTNDQLDAISVRDREVIVSASAGSGKTAVLIERIFKMITDEERPVDVDRLLVVTFTNAAAAEMRERLTERIDEALNTQEGELSAKQKANLIRQSALVGSAQISTIDSFCKRVVGEHFNEADIDPGYRLADEAELKLLKSDVMEKFLEDKFAGGEEAFLSFSAKVSTGSSNEGIEDIIEDLYRQADSTPDPKAWLYGQLSAYETEGIPNEAFVLSYTENVVRSAVRDLSAALKICRRDDGPSEYEKTVSLNLESVEGLLNLSFEELYDKINGLDFGRMPSVRKISEDRDPVLYERVKKLREKAKKDKIEDIKKKFFSVSVEEIKEDTKAVKEDIKQAVELTAEFFDVYAAAKRKKNLADFSDVAHMAYKVLVDEEGNPTPSACEYRDRFYEILIDEYQDSNDLQESILRSVSGESVGRPNIFMVGDVKQSIYRFRQAKPELFTEKYNTYEKHQKGKAGGTKEKIILKENFRSGLNVLASVNAVFSGLMHEELGNVEYDEDALLKAGRPDTPDYGPDEIMILDLGQESEDVTFEGNIDAEASMIAERIRQLHAEGTEYGEIVILLRSMKGYGDTFVNILNNEGVPAVCETGSGYFSAWEVQVMLNLLSILDNPRQDIPLASVMMSYIGGFIPDEMAEIRIKAKDKHSFYEALLESSDNEKCGELIEKIGIWREKAKYMSINDLISMLYEKTKFYEYVSAMPGGIVRRANLDMLCEKAASFEESSYHGLFHFVRYIEKLKKYEIDYGEATASAGENVVRIMSIHKSKGLQFPVVFVAGIGKNFNTMDENKTVAVHSSFGIAMKRVNLETRTKKNTLLKNAVVKKMHEDSLGEELRIFYVAMTRAEKRLILSGVSDNFSKLKETSLGADPDYAGLMKSRNFLSMLMKVYVNTEGIGNILRLNVVTADSLLSSAKQSEYERHVAAILKLTGAIENADEQTLSLIEKEAAYEYPFMSEALLKGKMTVSEIKALSHSEEEFGEIVTYEKEAYIPSFAREEEKIAGNVRGTIYHSVMEHMDFVRMAGADKNAVSAYLDNEVAEGRITEEDRKAVSDYKIMTALNCPFSKRMARAAEKNALFRESPFVIAVENDILIQGIIDVWFEEEDGLVLLDYKTDRVPDEGGEDLLSKRYKIQLDYYERALLQTTGKKVKERIIYSFDLGKEINV